MLQNVKRVPNATLNIMDLINLDQYPIHLGPQDQNYKKCVSDLRSKLVHEGVALCPDFLRPEALVEAVSNVSKVKSKAWKTDTSHNIYLDSGDPDFPTSHIRNKLLPTTVSPRISQHCGLFGHFPAHETIFFSLFTCLGIFLLLP